MLTHSFPMMNEHKFHYLKFLESSLLKDLSHNLFLFGINLILIIVRLHASSFAKVFRIFDYLFIQLRL